jgi:hypothetical protein
MFVLILDLLDVTQTSPWMLRLVKGDFGAQICLKLCEVSVLEARDGHEVLEELNAPVARIILRLVLDVVTLLAVPGAHADVLWDDFDVIVDLEGSRQCGKKAVHQVFGVRIEGCESAHIECE